MSPTVRMMVRPRWLAALVLTLAVAGVFAALAQWQVGRAAEEAFVADSPTESVRPLVGLAKPGEATEQSLTGSRVQVSGHFIPGDAVFAEGRLRVSGTDTIGVWVIAHLVTEEDIDLPVVIGWAETRAEAEAAASLFDAGNVETVEVIGRFLPSEAPAVPDAGTDPSSTMHVAVGELVNRWQDVAPGGTYFGYVISESPADGLERIDTPAPQREAQLNALNVFYAIEWMVFAGFALYIWYRLVRDAVEREADEREASGA